jgi:hypothetical protein
MGSLAYTRASLSRLGTANFTFSEGEGAGIRHLNLLPVTSGSDLDSKENHPGHFDSLGP